MAGDASRVRKELAECARDTNSGVTAVPKGSSMSELEGTVLGPEVRKMEIRGVCGEGGCWGALASCMAVVVAP